MSLGQHGNTTLSGNTQITGGMATSDNLNMSGNIRLNYDPSVLNNLQNLGSMSYYSKVPGSWKEF